MSRLRIVLGALAAFAVALALGQGARASFVQTQRDQISVYILVNVTPAPLTYVPHAQETPTIAVNVRKRGRGSNAMEDAPDFVLGDNVVAQAQGAVRVQAEVSPNPNATLLYSNQPVVTINATAGTTVTTPDCVYTVTAHTLTTTSWTLDDGLSNDFSSAFPGNTLSNNTYIQSGSPNPTATPFVVYPNNNNTWYAFARSTGVQTYCVTLTLTVPKSVPGGAYSTNAVYTLYY